MQGSELPQVHGIDIGAVLDEHFGDFEMAV